MKVTFIVPHFPPHIGGGEQLYFDVCRGLLQKGHSVRVVTSNSGGVTGHVEMDGLEVYYCNWHLKFGHPVVRSKDLIEHVRWCDVVHTAIYSTVLKSVTAARKAGKPCVVTFHEVMGDKWSLFERNPVKAAAFRFYEGQLLKASGNVHVVSEATRRDYLKFCKKPGRIFRIYNFLNLPEDKYIEESETSFKECFSLEEGQRGILYFGRPAANKGIFVLIEAIRLVRDSLPGKDIFFCLLLSKNPKDGRKKAEKLIRKYALQDYVRIHDSLLRNDQLKVLSEADLCVIPSVTEGFGYAACEASHYKRPLICSDGGSLPEVVSGKVKFFENRNARDLADKLTEYINNGTSGFEDLPEKTFDREEIIGEYLNMYAELTASGGPANVRD